MAADARARTRGAGGVDTVPGRGTWRAGVGPPLSYAETGTSTLTHISWRVNKVSRARINGSEARKEQRIYFFPSYSVLQVGVCPLSQGGEGDG